MYNLLKIKKEEFNTIILNTAAKKGMSAAIVEKDFWVCITLDYLFHHCKWKDHFAFKGGTCLSKVYHLIERFSEDIDLILDWRILGYTSKEPWEERSNTKQQKFIDDSKDRLFSFLKNDFLPEFISGMGSLLQLEINAFIEEEDLGTVVFAYPSSFKDNTILNTIRLEIGILASWIPLQKASIKSFLAEEYPQIFNYSDIDLVATTAERTFWEKATILHQEAFRPEYSLVPPRYSRHYYDVYCIYKKGVINFDANNSKLLEEVSAFKARFYPRSWVRYDLAKFGSLKLLPASHSHLRLQKDYEDMKTMIYGEYPSYDEIMSLLKKVEEEINKK